MVRQNTSMSLPGGTLRGWITGLSDDELRELISIPGPLPHWAQVAGARRRTQLKIGQRELFSVRVWLRHANSRDLRKIAEVAAGFAMHRLEHCGGYAEQTRANPEPEDLEEMIGFLEPVLARLTLHGLLDENEAVAELIARDWERLLAAAARPEGSCRCHSGEIGCHGTDDSDDRLAEVGGTTEQPNLDEGEGRVPENDLPSLGLTELADSARTLREQAALVAESLDRAAVRVRSGLGLDEDMLAEVAEAAGWSAERAVLAARITAVGAVWNIDEGFARLETTFEQLRAEAEAQAARAEQLVLRESRRASLLALIEQAGQDSGGAFIDGLKAAVCALDDEIASLGGAPAPAQPPTDVREDSAGREPDRQPEEAAASNSASPEEAPGASPPPAEIERPVPPRTIPQSLGMVEAPSEALEPGMELDAPQASMVEAEGEEPGQNLVYLAWQNAQDDSGDITPSPVERLVTAGRFQEAYWLTRASAEPTYRADCLAFADAAFSCDRAEEATLVMTRFAPDIEALHDDRPALIMAAAASLRAGLVAGWPNDLLLQTEPALGLSEHWGALLKCGSDLLGRYQRFDPAVLNPSVETGPVLVKADIAQAADALEMSLKTKKTPYARATQVQKRLVAAEQPLGKALTAVRAWATGTADAAVLEEVWDTFRKRDVADRIIEEADAEIRTPKQAKEPIEAKAKRSLLHRIDEVVTLLSKARALAAPEAEEPGDTAAIALRHAIEQFRKEAALPGPEGAALGRLRAWFLREQSAPVPRRALNIAGEGEDHPVIVPGTEALLAASDLPRSREGLPCPDESGFADAVAALLEPVDIRSVLTGYAVRGDLHLADALAEAVEQGLVPAATEGAEAIPADWRAFRDAEGVRWSTRLRETHRVAAGLLAELRTQDLDEQSERALVGRLEKLTEPTPDGAFREAVEDIHDFETDLRQRLGAYLERLRERLDALEVSEHDRKRLTEILQVGDTVTAEECLSLLREGSTLPDWSDVDWGDELSQFMAGLEQVTPAKAGHQGYSAWPWAGHYADKPLTEGSRNGLESWDALCNPVTRGSEWQRHVPSVLRTLGLEGRGSTFESSQQPVRGVQRLTAKLTVSEAASGYVAALGSAATTFTILVVSDEQRGRSPLELLRTESGACIILYLYPLGVAGRRAMAVHARTLPQQALVVDPAVFGWMAARSPRSYRATQRVTLPWTAFTPYTPYVAGLVPPEVFYGRNVEMATVVDPLGALFLYGGRQLGKSALLRKVEADFPSTPDRKAVYLDLKARGVGEAEPADRIWSVLSTELKRVGVLGPKIPAGANADVLLDHVRRWLGDNRERRLLVLADEADAFLMADSKAVHGRGGDVAFANVLRLKGLMDDTDRRFKVVFAGLHQVQRFSHLSNVPLAHGEEIRIGPLKPTEAQRLVVAPMAAFGYRFASPNLVWRVLAATNYQAGLVQIFCDRLVAALREKSIGSAMWPITVTEEDIRAVADSAQVHRSIANRLRYTINLEDRYRVLALVIALRSHTDRFQLGYDADVLLSEAKLHWPDGFNQLTANDVKIYLDEMVGLGLLVETGRGVYAVRSPNVVRMLGTHEDLKLELRQTEFSLPYDYNPRFSRRLVGADSRSNIARYSPLTEQQLFEATSPGVTVVCLTKAHSPYLVTVAIESYAGARGLSVHKTGPQDVARILTQATQKSKQPSVVIAEVRMCGQQALADCLAKLHAYTSRGLGVAHRSAILIVDPMTWHGFEDERVARVLRPERWNADGLHAWPECPFDTSDKRRRLANATGGWPYVVERAVHEATRGGVTPEVALDLITAHFDEPANAAEHLERIELDQGMIELLSTWAQYVEPGEACSYADIASVTAQDLDEVRQLMGRLVDHGVLDDSEGGCALDPITFQALGVVRRNT